MHVYGYITFIKGICMRDLPFIYMVLKTPLVQFFMLVIPQLKNLTRWLNKTVDTR